MSRFLLWTPAFVRAMRRFVKKHPQAEAKVRSVLEQLAADALEPSLKAHKLGGVMVDSWTCSAGYDLRIICEFVGHEGSEAIRLLTIGTHDEVY